MSNYTSSMGYELPPLIFKKGTRGNKKYRQAVMDAFERIATEQVRYNIENFDDFYKMQDGSLTKKELKHMTGQFNEFNDLLNTIEVPPLVYHWDIIAGVINTLVGKLIEMQDKVVVTDVGEAAESDLMEEYNKRLQTALKEAIENKVRLHFAEIGLNPDTLQEVSSEEERQALIQQIQQERRKVISESQERVAETAKFKTQGVIWGEATMQEDKELLNFDKQYQELFRQFLSSGTCAKITKVVQDTYKPFVFDSRTVFHSKDIGKVYLNDFQYAGRQHPQTPSQVLEEWGSYLSYNEQNMLLQGDMNWKSLSEINNPTGSVKDVLNYKFSKEFEVPFLGYTNNEYMKRVEELTGLPMGERYYLNKDGIMDSERAWIPRMHGSIPQTWTAPYLETRFLTPNNLCTVTEVYFRAMEPIGYLSYEDEDGNQIFGEIVTEDILTDFLKENNIKNIKNKGMVDVVDDFEMNTIVWQLRPVVGWGVKIVPSNTNEPIYIGVEPMENQIRGLSDTDVKLPITGLVGVSIAKKMAPWQDIYNFCWNTIRQLLEKELGSFALLSVGNLLSEYQNTGDPEDALMQVRNMAKRTGLMLVNDDPETMGEANRQFQTYTISHSAEIQTRHQIAQIAKQELYASIGVQLGEGLQKTQYTTNENIRVSQEAMQTQLAHIFKDFNDFMVVDQNQHLSIAHFVQSNNLDKRMYYTKSQTNINWLIQSDPKFPLRMLGITASDDNKKRKDLEKIKATLLQRNTMDIDAKYLIELTSSSSWRELMSIADQERQVREQKEALLHQRQMEQIEATKQATIEIETEKWKREEYSKSLDRKNKIDIETIEAYGRAADKEGNAEDFSKINSARAQALNETIAAQQYEAKMRDLDIKSQDLAEKRNNILNEQLLKSRALDLKERELESRENIARMNKN